MLLSRHNETKTRNVIKMKSIYIKIEKADNPINRRRKTNETREQVVANAIAPCTNEAFLAEYLRRASEDLIIG